MNNLKPCPFCGGKAAFVVKGNIARNSQVAFAYRIECSKCGYTPIDKTYEMYVNLDGNGTVKITAASEIIRQNMIEVWNKRTTEKGGAE